MQYKQFGKNGPEVSRLGFGCMRLPTVGEGASLRVNDELASPMIQRAYELGINFFDTAWGYLNRDGQRAVGEAVKSFRDKVYLSSKLPPAEVQEPADFMRKLELSLRMMQTDHLDYYHMHALNANSWSRAKQMEMRENMRRAKEQGLIRHISFSFHDVPELMVEIADEGIFDTVLCQYNLIDQRNEQVMQTLAGRGMGVMVMGPIGGGTIATGGDALLRKFDTKAESAVELALRFVYSNPAVSLALSGMQTIEMIEENVRLAEKAFAVTEEESQSLHAVNDQLKSLSDLYCTGCDYCDVCPKKIRPSRHFRPYNNMKIWGLEEPARQAYAQIGANESYGALAAECIGCGACAQKCPQKIDIPRRLKEVAAYFAK